MTAPHPQLTDTAETPSAAGDKPVALTKAGRRRRFQRTPEFRPDRSRAGRLAITKRDLDIIATTARLRFLSMHQACRLFACGCPRVYVGNQKSRPAPVVAHHPNCSCTCHVGSGREPHLYTCPALHRDDQHLARRMRELFQAYGYLERPLAQLQLRVRDGIVNPGSVSTVYSVTRAGLDLLSPEQRDSINRGKLSFVSKSDGGRMFMDHTLHTGDVHVGVTVGLRTLSHLHRLTEAELLQAMNPKRRGAPQPFALRVKHKGRKLTAICDLPFALENKTTGKRRLILTEVDMGHMPVVRRGATQSSLIKKMMTYAHAFDQKLMQSELGFSNTVILFLTTSEQRVAHCVKAVSDHFASAPNLGRIFLFGTHAQVENILTADFVDGRGRKVRLME